MKGSDETDEWQGSYEIVQESSEIVPSGAPLSIISTTTFNRFELELTRQLQK
jgi:hypothetical protein